MQNFIRNRTKNPNNKNNYHSLKSRKSQISDIPQSTHHKWKSHISPSLLPFHCLISQIILMINWYSTITMDGPWYCYKTLSLNFHFIDKKKRNYKSYQLQMRYSNLMTPLHWKAAFNITPFQKSVAEQWQRNNNLYEVSSSDTKPLQKMSLYTWEHQGTAGGWARRTCLGNLQMGTRQELFMESTWGLYLCVGLLKWVSAEQHKFKQADLPAIRTTPSLCWLWILGNQNGKN